MKRFFTWAALFSGSLLIWNCTPEDNDTTIAERDRQEVYNEDIIEIETFLKSNSIEIREDGVNFETTDLNASNAIWNQSENPLQSITIKNLPYYTNSQGLQKLTDNVEYKLYYIIVNEGGGETPNMHDNAFTSYTGYKFDKTIFDTYPFGFWSAYPAFSSYTETIAGYRQILQKIKTASAIIENEDGTYTYENPGRVIVFMPSGLGYFASSPAGSTIGTYEPLIFDISLIAKKEVDHDNDGLLDKYEDVNSNGDLWDDDTDGDGKPNFLDLDDDGDGYTTRQEITYTVEENGEMVQKLYEFEQIPNCENGSVKKHLDKNCH
ncbi:hypothetical protein MG290_13220 [Flavobacterium sp. CBA20B-1]|uniref:FKBP-type peptidyl-prolyl cis-trans isomerase n=1 Tax=unclassified Flavobacterium TaxID=196869 RepID=UPI002225773F|nr:MULTISPECIES: hypothetical protein [unclassified Flavobacterium]WCM41884.1 hypothetical protein MG290_13220 [Flavobacterium sp. CBA20B-1]